MNLLSSAQFEQAMKYINNYARPVDQAMYELEFGTGTSEQVINELRDYQSTDHGFGHALEPDIRMDNSSVIATNVALQYLTDIQINNDHKLVQQAIGYLCSQSNHYKNMIYFPKVSLEVLKHPRAPWWDTREIEAPELARWPNPNAEVTGYLNRWSQHIPDEYHAIVGDCNSTMRAYLDEYETTTNFDIYQFLCWKRALPHLPTDLGRRVETMLLAQVNEDTLTSDNLQHAPAHWLVTEKSSLLYQHYPEQIRQLLQAEIGQQAEDGGWHPSWHWDSSVPWQQVEREWTGKLTVELLLTLKYLDLIEI